jgi:DNA-binding response OmpR family regulator
MDSKTLILLERHRSGHRSFAEVLKQRYHVISVMSGKQAIQMSQSRKCDLIIVDSIALNAHAVRIVKSLRKNTTLPIVHLLDSTVASVADAVLVMPFTPIKLNNAIKRLLTQTQAVPTAALSELIQLDVERRILTANGQETHLTPKMAQLVEVFLRNPQMVLDRKQLMEQVWQTDYVGDTRTLDVHIHRFRKAIEKDRKRPLILVTERGIGYRLNITPEHVHVIEHAPREPMKMHVTT